jgi:hypothetical protein
MVLSALLGGVFLGIMAIPHVPLVILFLLLAATTMLEGPFNSARASTLPDILTGDRYVAGQSLSRLVNQGSQVIGFALGGLLLTWVSPRKALALDAATFLASALLLHFGVKYRALDRSVGDTKFVDDIRDGARIVFTSPILRSLVSLAWAGTAFTVVPEALAAPYAHHLHGGPATTGLILSAGPVGMIIGVVFISRMVAPSTRLRLIRPLAFLACLPLMVCLADPAVGFVLGALVFSGIAMSYNIPANQAFVQALEPGVRGRAFGLAVGGLSIGQGLSLLFAGVFAEWLSPSTVVGLAGLAGACVMGVICTMSGLGASLEGRTESLEAA